VIEVDGLAPELIEALLQYRFESGIGDALHGGIIAE
jgi:hypothetical protein